MKRVHTVLWADDIAVEFGYQALTTGVRGILRKAWSGELLVKSIEMVAAGDLCYEKVLSDQFLMSRRKAVTHQEHGVDRLYDAFFRLTRHSTDKRYRQAVPSRSICTVHMPLRHARNQDVQTKSRILI